MSEAAPHDNTAELNPPDATNTPGADGNTPSGLVTALAMSPWISAGVSARLYSRTSSISPLNHSPQIALPPILNALLDVTSEPDPSSVAVWTPLT